MGAFNFLCLAVSLLLIGRLPACQGQTTSCVPGDNCKPPDCRCWNDDKTPGDVAKDSTPQIVLFTFEYAVNSGNVERYTSLFKGLTNPNNCPAVGTFYVQETNSDFDVIKSLYDAGHEIGVTSADGTVPEDFDQWKASIQKVKQALADKGIQKERVLGVRAPNLRPGGLDQFLAMTEEGFLYDSSCSTSRYDDQSSLIWPYTYDFAPGPACDNGAPPEQEFQGKWQILIADLEFNGAKCATPAACTAVASQRDAFDMLYNSFRKHYEGSRSPFTVVINPEWAAVDYKAAGTREFLEYIRAEFSDTWILTAVQGVEWVRNPVDNDKAISDFPPWTCP